MTAVGQRFAIALPTIKMFLYLLISMLVNYRCVDAAPLLIWLNRAETPQDSLCMDIGAPKCAAARSMESALESADSCFG
jgi:hypothetical protein